MFGKSFLGSNTIGYKTTEHIQFITCGNTYLTLSPRLNLLCMSMACTLSKMQIMNIFFQLVRGEGKLIEQIAASPFPLYPLHM